MQSLTADNYLWALYFQAPLTVVATVLPVSFAQVEQRLESVGLEERGPSLKTYTGKGKKHIFS